MISLQRSFLQLVLTSRNSKVCISRLVCCEFSSEVSLPSSDTYSPSIKCPSYNGFVQDEWDKAKLRVSKWDEYFNQTTYYFHNGLRHVYPYYHLFDIFVKDRWIGHTLEHAMQASFYPVVHENWVERGTLNGSITVNGSPTSKDHLLVRKDKIQHLIHRHELPVRDLKVDILHKDSHIVVVNKPPGLPIHPTGRYQHNTLMYILAREHMLLDIHVIHRLDMGTSGVMIFGRNKSAAAYFASEMRHRKASKTYVARVLGKFPEETIMCDGHLAPIDLRTRIMMVHSKGKPSQSSFTRLSYNAQSDTSVVLCRPLTGRTHQLRVHLQYLGFPIHNDPLYNNPVFGPDRGKGGHHVTSSADIIKAWEAGRSRWNCKEDARPGNILYEPWIELSKGAIIDPSKAIVDDVCELCPLHLIVNKDDFGFHLHALEYSGDDWCFSSPMPEWAHPDWKPVT